MTDEIFGMIAHDINEGDPAIIFSVLCMIMTFLFSFIVYSTILVYYNSFMI